MTEYTGRVGVARREYAGMYVEVEPDQSGAGWHIWLSQGDPRQGPSDGWDMWADDEAQVAWWVGPDQLDVEWLD